MGEPRWSEDATQVSWRTPTNRVLLLCSGADAPRMELSRPPLELLGVEVDIHGVLGDPQAVQATLAGVPAGTLVAVVVSAGFDRRLAQPCIELISHVPGIGLRTFILDLNRHSSVVRQCRAVSRALEGLHRTTEIDQRSRGGLTSSASRCASVGGTIAVGSGAAGATALRVVHPPLLIQRPLNEAAEVIPADVRIEVPRRVRPRATAETRPDICAHGLPQPYAS